MLMEDIVGSIVIIIIIIITIIRLLKLLYKCEIVKAKLYREGKYYWGDNGDGPSYLPEYYFSFTTLSGKKKYKVSNDIFNPKKGKTYNLIYSEDKDEIVGKYSKIYQLIFWIIFFTYALLIIHIFVFIVSILLGILTVYLYIKLYNNKYLK